MNRVSLNISSDDDFTGNGMELLMNDKYAAGNPSSSSGGGNIEDLEKELNDLSNHGSSNNNHFGDDISLGAEPVHHMEPLGLGLEPDVKFNDNVSVGEYTSNLNTGVGKSWDGYGQFNDIPQTSVVDAPQAPQLTKDEMLREKYKYTKLLDKLEKKGVTLSKHYTMEHPLMEMQGEYETIMEDKKKDNSTKLMGNALMMFIKGLEYLNERFDPFELELDGLGEQVSENITDYDDIFGELHEKYKTNAQVAPELRLMFQLGGSAAMVHMTNTMFKTAAPGVDDLMRQNPDLARQFQTAAVNSMSTTAPGLSNFMSGSIPQPQPQPPQTVPTQGRYAVPTPGADRNGNNAYGRPDLSHAGVPLHQQHSGVEDPTLNQSSRKRTEMKGPSNLDDILSGLKPQTQTRTVNVAAESDNIISADDARSLQSSTNAPKRSRRRVKSDKNTVSVSI